MMRAGTATNHGGFGLQQELLVQLGEAGHEVVDFSANDRHLRRVCKVSLLEAEGHVSIPRDSR